MRIRRVQPEGEVLKPVVGLALRLGHYQTQLSHALHTQSAFLYREVLVGLVPGLRVEVRCPMGMRLILFDNVLLRFVE